jgi:hypothetical protein
MLDTRATLLASARETPTVVQSLNRELVPFARGILEAVENFMDDLLSAFEDERITRKTWT